MNELELIKPALRFPSFKGHWLRRKLGDFLTFKNGINADKSKYGSGYKFVNVLDVMSDQPLNYDSIIGSVNVSESEFKKNEVTYGNILFQRSSETREDVGVSNVYLDNKRSATFGGFIIRGKQKEETNYHPLFMWHLLKTCTARKEIIRLSGGSTRYNIGQESLESVSIYVTENPEEQEKIAESLGLVDEKLFQLEKKLDLLKQYKTGVLQKIFSQEIRFKDDHGNDFSDWKEKQFADVYDFQKTNSLSRSCLNYESGDFQNIHYGDIHTKYHPQFYGHEEQVPFVNDDCDVSNLTQCKKGDLVFADASEDYADVGKAIEIIELTKKPLLAGLHTFLVRPKNRDEVVVGFSGYLMRIFAVRRQIMRFAQGISVLGISKTNLGKVTLLLPSPGEQKKIADFLTAIDDKIKMINQQVTQMRDFRRSLLQQMFV
ncbi:MAG: restriction endonuclease subunit S [bacterium]|nr:restriction endonuclease subunit S [bacterium]